MGDEKLVRWLRTNKQVTWKKKAMEGNQYKQQQIEKFITDDSRILVLSIALS